MLRGRFSHVLTLVLLLAVPYRLCLLVLVLGASMIARLLAAATKPLNCRMLGGAVISVWVRTTISHAGVTVMRILTLIRRCASLIAGSLLVLWCVLMRRVVTALSSLLVPAAGGVAVAVHCDACGAASRVLRGLRECIVPLPRGRKPGIGRLRGGVCAGGAAQTNVCTTLRSL